MMVGLETPCAIDWLFVALVPLPMEETLQESSLGDAILLGTEGMEEEIGLEVCQVPLGYSSTPSRRPDFPDDLEISPVLPFDPGGCGAPPTNQISPDNIQVSNESSHSLAILSCSDNLWKDISVPAVSPLYRWHQKDITVMKYIDDISGTEKLHANYKYRSAAKNYVEHRYIHASQLEEMFKKIDREAKIYGVLITRRRQYCYA